MESVPRVTRAQRMDALSSQATVAGYRAVILAAERAAEVLPDADDRRGHGRRRPRCSCSAPASRASRRSRPPAGSAPSSRRSTPARRSRSRCESLGAKFVELEMEVGGRRRTRAATRPCSPRASRREQQQLLERHIADSDVVVTTALVPGQPAPRLIPATVVEAMRTGLGHRRPGRRDRRQLRADRAGRGRRAPRRHPDRHAQPAVRHAAPRQPDVRPKHPGRARAPRRRRRARSSTSTTRSPPTPSSRTTAACHEPAPPGGASVNESLLIELTVFVLAAFVGIEVISKVPTTLHTPLMSGTNAIHGDRHRRRDPGRRGRLRHPDHSPRHDRRRVRRLERRRRLPRHRPHAAHVPPPSREKAPRMSKADCHRRRLPDLRRRSSSSA